MTWQTRLTIFTWGIIMAIMDNLNVLCTVYIILFIALGTVYTILLRKVNMDVVWSYSCSKQVWGEGVFSSCVFVKCFHYKIIAIQNCLIIYTRAIVKMQCIFMGFWHTRQYYYYTYETYLFMLCLFHFQACKLPSLCNTFISSVMLCNKWGVETLNFLLKQTDLLTLIVGMFYICYQ